MSLVGCKALKASVVPVAALALTLGASSTAPAAALASPAAASAEQRVVTPLEAAIAADVEAVLEKNLDVDVTVSAVARTGLGGRVDIRLTVVTNAKAEADAALEAAIAAEIESRIEATLEKRLVLAADLDVAVRVDGDISVDIATL
ncbi:hypothetical protein HW130_30650 [Streptomyces sp. PKU-EA00015]|uniref:hypothetical protein n=1 Tax=Streptomyces sp. PKU-EA00015 TaxID=2748326 RepID=UPI0015A4C87B|nr:hypothetical protein [Streptomyces sp. PKU-EA00015]NWF30565.1 hypothetical protein [Streptomyces sp. PKU-EA00015]